MKFFKSRVPKHQRFEYTPRYYNPKKEDLERRVAAAKGNAGSNPEAMKGRISSGLRRSRNNNPELRRRTVYRSNMLLLAIIVVLVVILFTAVNVYLPQIEGWLGGGR